jgi:hypothetical protein
MLRMYRYFSRLALVMGLWSVQGCFTDTEGGAQHSIEVPVENPGNPPGTPLVVLDIQGAETWQSRFIKDSSEIPWNGFKAFYFRDSAVTLKADSERVAFPVLSYAYSGPYGIPAYQFNAYWIGKFAFAENATWRIDLSQNNSVARILIDKREIYSGRESRSLLHAFAKGAHSIEIEYKNDWHTITFSVLLAPAIIDTPAGEIDTAATGAEYWFAGAYESGKSDLSLDVALRKSAKPVVLFLSSYEVVRWNIIPADSTQVLAVFVDSYQPQSTVAGLPASVPVATRKGIPFAYKLLPDCHPETGYCETNQFAKLVGFMADEFKLSLTGFTGDYNPASLIVPEIPLDSAKYREIEERTRALAEASRLRWLGDVFPRDTAATWQSHFIASAADIPVGKFKAFYFSDKHPETVLHSETAAAAAMKYSWSDLYHLDANDFAGYWVGNFEFAAPAILEFGVAQSHAQTAIYVDKRPILIGREETAATCSVPAGTHLIEIQHVNNWHTIDFAVTLRP